MFIQKPDPSLSAAENILYMMRPDGKYTRLEARLLDLCLVLHAEHGGGNNSAFTVHVVTSSGTDTYSTIAAALGSLKGPKHGGANHQGLEMFEDLKRHCPDWQDEDALRAYLEGLLRGEGFDHTGLIYGMGHAVYSVSDPRAVILKSFVEQLSSEKGCHDEYQLYATVERLAGEVIAKNRKIYKGVCATWTSTAALCTGCLGCRWICSHRSSPSPALPAGLPTAWRSLSTAGRSSVRNTSPCRSVRTTSRWKSGSERLFLIKNSMDIPDICQGCPFFVFVGTGCAVSLQSAVFPAKENRRITCSVTRRLSVVLYQSYIIPIARKTSEPVRYTIGRSSRLSIKYCKITVISVESSMPSRWQSALASCAQFR